MEPKQIIEKLGGPTKAARKLGVPVGTVYAWGQRASIPAWRMEQVQRALQDGQVS